MATATFELRDALLRKTVAWCHERSSFYRERFPSADFAGLEAIAQLPVLHRHQVVDHHAELRCDDALPAGIQHTTGTTGQFLQLYRSPSEQAFIWNFFAQQMPEIEAGKVRPLHLSLANAYHGALIPVPSRAYVLSVGVHDRAQASQAQGVLERSYDLPGIQSRISVITGTERMIMALTAYLLAKKFDFSSCQVRRIALFGGHVPLARKQLLAQIWFAEDRKGTIQDHYSLTEMFGGAKECGLGGPWVFDPHIIPEVVHPTTHEPIESGVGMLLLTSLFPFVQQMPLVRYVTGDLVEVVDGPEGPAGLTVRYVGRMPRSVLHLHDGKVRPLLLSGPLYERLLSLPDLAITPRFPDLQIGVGLELTGDLHYRVDHREAAGQTPEQITIEIGLRYAPWMYPSRVATLVKELAEDLFALNPYLAECVADKRVELHLRPKPASEVPIHDSK